MENPWPLKRPGIFCTLWRKAGYGKNAGEMSGRRAGETASHPFNGFYHPRQGGSGLSPPFRFSLQAQFFQHPLQLPAAAAQLQGSAFHPHKLRQGIPFFQVLQHPLLHGGPCHALGGKAFQLFPIEPQQAVQEPQVPVELLRVLPCGKRQAKGICFRLGEERGFSPVAKLHIP